MPSFRIDYGAEKVKEQRHKAAATEIRPMRMRTTIAVRFRKAPASEGGRCKNSEGAADA